MSDIEVIGLRTPTTIPKVVSVALDRLTDDGRMRLSWEPAYGTDGRRARVYGRMHGSPDRRAHFLGEGVRSIELPGLPDGTIDVWVCPELGERKVYAGPTHAQRVTLAVPEFVRRQLNPVTGFRATVNARGILLEWDRSTDVGVTHYEIRRGTVWEGATVVATPTGTSVELTDLAPGTRTYLIRARYGAQGLYSSTAASVTVNWIPPTTGPTVLPIPPGTLFLGGIATDFDATVTTATLTPSLTHAGGTVYLDAGEVEGVMTLPPVDAGGVGSLFWTIEVDSYEEWPSFGRDHPDALVLLGDVEAMWLTPRGRQPSRARPAPDLLVTPADVDAGTVSLDALLAGSTGESAYSKCIVEARWDKNGSGDWTEWGEFCPGRVRAQKMESRIRLLRCSDDVQRHVYRIAASAVS